MKSLVNRQNSVQKKAIWKKKGELRITTSKPMMKDW
jgi:hypothetical protein